MIEVRCIYCHDEVDTDDEVPDPSEYVCPPCVRAGERVLAEESARECEGDYWRDRDYDDRAEHDRD